MPLPGKGKTTAPVAETPATQQTVAVPENVHDEVALDSPPAPEALVEPEVADSPEQVEQEEMPFDADATYEEPASPAGAAAVASIVAEIASEAAVPATTSGTAVPATKGSNTSNEVLSSLADQGFEGVGIEYGTFPQVALHNTGKFESSEGWALGESFKALFMGAKIKWIVKNTKCEKRDEDLVYTYDKVIDVNGTPVAETIAHWAEQGWGHEFKEYREVPAEIIDGDHDGEMVILSIPSTSIRRLNRHLIRSARGKVDLMEAATVCSVGAQITSVDHPFFPWDFGLDK